MAAFDAVCLWGAAVVEIAQIFANYAVPTAIVIVMLVGVFSPPRWVVAHVDRRTEAYEKSQQSIASSVAAIQNAQLEMQHSVAWIDKSMAKMVELRHEDNKAAALILGKCTTAVGECKRMADSCERMANTIEPRRRIWSDIERANDKGPAA